MVLFFPCSGCRKNTGRAQLHHNIIWQCKKTKNGAFQFSSHVKNISSIWKHHVSAVSRYEVWGIYFLVLPRLQGPPREANHKMVFQEARQRLLNRVLHQTTLGCLLEQVQIKHSDLKPYKWLKGWGKKSIHGLRGASNIWPTRLPIATKWWATRGLPWTRSKSTFGSWFTLRPPLPMCLKNFCHFKLWPISLVRREGSITAANLPQKWFYPQWLSPFHYNRFSWLRVNWGGGGQEVQHINCGTTSSNSMLTEAFCYSSCLPLIAKRKQ